MNSRNPPPSIRASSFKDKKVRERKPRRKNYFEKSLWPLLILLSLFSAYYAFDYLYLSKASSRLGLIPTQQVSVILTGDSDFEIQRSFYEDLSSQSSSLSINQIDNFFDREFQKYDVNRPDAKPVMKIIVHPAQALGLSLVEHFNFENQVPTEKIFEFLNQQNIRFKMADDAAIIIYLMAPKNSLPRNFFQARSIKDNTAIMFINPETEPSVSIMRKIAAEVARIFGATSKIEHSGATKIPEGLANPNQSPLFPQAHADLMGAGVPVSLIETRPIQSFNDIIIGPQTAEELGWTK